MENNIKASIEALTVLLLAAILTGWAGTIQIHVPGGGVIFDGMSKPITTQIDKHL